MTRPESLLAAVFLCLALAASLVAGGVASIHAPAGPLTEMVICADGGEAVVLLDAAGEPVRRDCNDRHCPDCLPPLLALAAAPVAEIADRASAGRTALPDPVSVPQSVPLLQARGPPYRKG